MVNRFKDIILHLVVSMQLRDCKTVLDVGCGDDSPLQYVKGKFKSEGLDIYEKSIKISKKKKIHNTYKLGDVDRIEKIYRNNSFEAVIAFDLIEHFKKKEGLRLLNKFETIASKKVIILTPNGFLPQGKLYGNEHQEHKSGWDKKDFKKRGYVVYGLRGLKYLRNNYVSPRFKPKNLWGVIIVFTEIFMVFIPRFSFHLLAVKEKVNSKGKNPS